MIICSNCGKENTEGTIFCVQCGVALEVLSLGTKQLEEAVNDDLHAGSETLSDEHIIFLHIRGFEDPVTIKVLDKVVLGRAGGEADGFALINLEGFGAEDKGVSRRHASLTREGTLMHLTDLGSTNFTYLNGQRVNQNDYLVIRDGDELRLGYMQMRVFYK